jgi:tRNA threonylcarbamoyl adenosine modification protein (Sua5/YciO/YrdC/YwlC family)
VTQRFTLHPRDPQPRLLKQAAEMLSRGALVAMPTDACYVLACQLDDEQAVERLRALRGVDDRHLLTPTCADLSQLAVYAQVDNRQYRFLREWTPGAYTFVLPATREVPRRLAHPSRRTIGLEVPHSPVALGLLRLLGAPVLTSSLILPAAGAASRGRGDRAGDRQAHRPHPGRGRQGYDRPRWWTSPATIRSWCAVARGPRGHGRRLNGPDCYNPVHHVS